MNSSRCVYYDWSVTLPNNLQHKHNVLFSCLSAYFEVASSIAFSFVRTCEVPTSHDFALQSRATEFLGLHRITCRRVPCIGTCGQVSPPRLLFHNITKAFNQESSWMEKRHCPPRQKKRSLNTQPSFYHGPEDSDLRHLLAPRYGTHHLISVHFCSLCIHEGSNQSFTSRLHKLQFSDFPSLENVTLLIDIHARIISFFTMRPHLPST